MANDNINIGASSSYNYAYTKPIEVEQQQKKIDSSVIGGASNSTTTATASVKQNETFANNIEKTQDAQKNGEIKSLYEIQQEEIKKKEEERKRKEEEEKRAEYLRELADKLNKRMNSFSEHIKFGINDRADSIVVSIVEQNNEKKIKELSQEDADKLFRRLDYVLGVLFDSKG